MSKEELDPNSQRLRNNSDHNGEQQLSCWSCFYQQALNYNAETFGGRRL